MVKTQPDVRESGRCNYTQIARGQSNTGDITMAKKRKAKVFINIKYRALKLCNPSSFQKINTGIQTKSTNITFEL